MKRNIQNKRTTGFQEIGEAPAVTVNGITAAAKALRNKFRSPLRFCAGGSLRRES